MTADFSRFLFLKFDLPGTPAGAGRSLFEKSSAKTFLPGTAVCCVIFGGEALLLRQSETQTGTRKRAFLCPFVFRTMGILIACDKNPPKMTWIAPRRAFYAKVYLWASEGRNTSFAKVFAHFRRKCAFHSKSDRPAPAGAPPNPSLKVLKINH